MGDSYVILIEKNLSKKQSFSNPYGDKSFYSKRGGICCTIQDADFFKSWSKSQIVVNKLRSELPDFRVYAVRDILKR
jgi:hypothetical protein